MCGYMVLCITLFCQQNQTHENRDLVMMEIRSLLFNTGLMLSLLMLVSCGGSSGDGDGAGVSNPENSTSPVNLRQINSVTIFSGNNQTAVVGEILPDPLVAQLKNSNDEILAGQTINFHVIHGGGSVFAGAATSDGEGYVREIWTLGTISGVQTVEVRAVDSDGQPVVFASFNAMAVPASPSNAVVVSGEFQTVPQGQELPSPITVLVQDRYGNSVPETSVTFSANDGGSVSPTLVNTNAEGLASTNWTLGVSLGTQTLDIIVHGITSDSVAASASEATVASITKISGDNQSTTQYLTTSLQPLVVSVVDSLGNPVQNLDLHATGGCRWYSPWPTTNAEGIAEINCEYYYPNESGQQQIEVSAIGHLAVDEVSTTFFVNVQPSNHPYDGRYDCSYSANGRFFRIWIANGQIIPIEITRGTYFGNLFNTPHRILLHGIFNEADGSLTGGSVDLFSSSLRIDSGLFTLDPVNGATGTGTLQEIEAIGADGDYNVTFSGEWNCERT